MSVLGLHHLAIARLAELVVAEIQKGEKGPVAAAENVLKERLGADDLLSEEIRDLINSETQFQREARFRRDDMRNLRQQIAGLTLSLKASIRREKALTRRLARLAKKRP